MKSKNIISFDFFNHFFTIRKYGDPHWGIRHLGGKRIAFDCGPISFIFESY